LVKALAGAADEKAEPEKATSRSTREWAPDRRASAWTTVPVP